MKFHIISSILLFKKSLLFMRNKQKEKHEEETNPSSGSFSMFLQYLGVGMTGTQAPAPSLSALARSWIQDSEPGIQPTCSEVACDVSTSILTARLNTCRPSLLYRYVFCSLDILSSLRTAVLKVLFFYPELPKKMFCMLSFYY